MRSRNYGVGTAKNTVLHDMASAPRGFGLRKIVKLDRYGWRESANQDVLTSSTTPKHDSTLNRKQIVWVAGNSDAIMRAVPIPFEYAKDSNSCAMVLTFTRDAVADGAVTISVGAERRGYLGDEDSDSYAGATLTLAAVTGEQQFEVDFSDWDIQPGDEIEVTVTPGTHAADAVALVGAHMVYNVAPNLDTKELRTGTNPFGADNSTDPDA